MSISHLAEDTVHGTSAEEKDRWWLENVYRGDVPQMTARVIVGGFLLGGLLSITNLYVGAKVGASLGVAVTAVILAFVTFRALHRVGLGRQFDVLENNILQSIASSAGYMSSPLIASMGAYMVVSGAVVPWWQMMMWLFGLAVMGVVFAVPLKRRFINDGRLPFPEGRACGLLLDTLHDAGRERVIASSTEPSAGVDPDAERRVGVVPARLLLMSGAVAGVATFLQSNAILQRMRMGFLHIPEAFDEWYYRLAMKQELWVPKLAGIPLRDLTVRPTLDIAMMALGGLMGMRTCVSLMVGATMNYLVLAPWMIARGDIAVTIGADGLRTVGFRAITTWSLWCGAAMMTTASLYAFLANVRVLRGTREMLAPAATADPLRHIELPRRLFLLGMPIGGAALVWMANRFFGVDVWMGIVAIPMLFVLTVIAVHATGLTSITPHGALGKITQLAYGVIAPRNITTNIAAAGIGAEVAFQTSNVIQNMKPGYMLGGKPRLQAAGHLIGAVSGAVFSVSVFYSLFLRNNPAGLISEEYPFPAIVVWRAVAEMLTQGLGALPTSAVSAAIGGALAGVALEFARMKSIARFVPAPVAMGLAFIIPFNICLAMFAGAAAFWVCDRLPFRWGRRVRDVCLPNRESICAGAIAGAALVGVGVAAVSTMVL